MSQIQIIERPVRVNKNASTCQCQCHVVVAVVARTGQRRRPGCSALCSCWRGRCPCARAPHAHLTCEQRAPACHATIAAGSTLSMHSDTARSLHPSCPRLMRHFDFTFGSQVSVGFCDGPDWFRVLDRSGLPVGGGCGLHHRAAPTDRSPAQRRR